MDEGELIHFYQIVEHGGEAVLLVQVNPDLQMQVIYVAPAFSEITGLSAQQVLDQDLLRQEWLVPEAQIALVHAAQQNAVVETTLRLYLPEERQVWLAMKILPLAVIDGMPTRLALIGRDISERAVMLAHIQKLDQVDALTGLLNRQALMERLRSEWNRAHRYKTTYALILLDIDEFEQLNRLHGRQIGDMVLDLLASHLQSLSRTQDSLARVDDDSFALLLPETDLAGAYKAAERLREKVATLDLATTERSLGVTVSLGVVQAKATDRMPEDIFNRAQAALQAAKEGGRNRSQTGV